MKILRVGDPHVTVSNISESENLIDFVISTAREHDIKHVEFLGDLFHTHAIIRVEVLDFWRKTFLRLHYAGLHTTTLVGNHDQPGSREKEQLMNALDVFNNAMPSLSVIKEPCIIKHGDEYMAAYIPYMSSKEDFIKASKGLFEQGAHQVLVAHQTFTGAQYDNGFYAEDGIDPKLVSQENIISGHIHATQQIGKCFYPGTPKWDTMSDANAKKGIWIFTHNADGSIADKEFISTEKVVTPIVKHVIEEGGEVPRLSKSARNYIELKGKSAWIAEMKKKYKGKASIKAKPTDRRVGNIDKDKMLSLVDYLKSVFEPSYSVSKEEINEYLRGINE